MAVCYGVGNQSDAVFRGQAAIKQELHLILIVVLCCMTLSPKLTVKVAHFTAMGLLCTLYRIYTELLQRCQHPFSFFLILIQFNIIRKYSLYQKLLSSKRRGRDTLWCLQRLQ